MVDMTTTGTAPSSSTAYSNYCGNRLPCGYCRIMMAPCPMFCCTPSITWTNTDITCTNSNVRKDI